ncbi:reverse transcriptase/maturase family protein [Dictyobacter arantiisoli]|uniref:Maturase n=1 Tax=Dictyobacter arantiisoli TaxID=2014874 RepID=A0A5A5TLE1_9CHLR|nr:reverse transcriptase/maturase family protein [Dictyobacter arantiisoli]GCF11949.1 maturase [Dictyobacter arantiisoli]
MRHSTTVLGMLHDRGRRGVGVDDLYRQLYNPSLYLRAYARLYAHPGAMTKGATDETVDAMSLNKIHQSIELLKHERFQWTPVRRTYIAKKNGKLRPLGLPTWTDKLLQEVIRSLLEAYYEPTFSDTSHGFRPGRGCHTALSQMQRTWTGTHWFLEGDIKACFDQLDHTVMLNILAEKIHDNRFLRLIKELLQAGYLEEWRYHCTLSGSPQGGVVSPLLSNIYLDKLDHYIETELLPSSTQGEERQSNLAYKRLTQRAYVARQKGEYQQAQAMVRLAQMLPRGDPFDPTYRRLRYVRYADDILFGFAGPKCEVEAIKSQLSQFLRETLKLELSQEKTLITQATTQPARFLGYEITVFHRNDQFGARKRRTLNGSVRLRIPADVVERKRAQYKQGGKPLRRMTLAPRSDYTILNTYQAEYRGLVQYYQLADNLRWLTRVHWDMQQSLLHTLAMKFRRSKMAMVRRYRSTTVTPQGTRVCLKVTQERKGKKPLVATFGGIPLKRKKEAILVDHPSVPIRYERKEVIKRLMAATCELCGMREENSVVHHVRKLAELEHLGKERPYWAQVMLKRRRKTLIVCPSCHALIHS